MEKIAKTYTIGLCKNGQTFQSMPNVVDDGPRPKAGDVIDGKWKVLGVLVSSSATEIFVDVVEV
jgi:hypothetical protein